MGSHTYLSMCGRFLFWSLVDKKELQISFNATSNGGRLKRKLMINFPEGLLIIKLYGLVR